MGGYTSSIFSLLVTIVLFALIVGQPTAARRTEGRPRHHKRYQLGDLAYVPRVRCGYGPAFSRFHEFNETLDDPNEDDGEDPTLRVAGGYDLVNGQFPSYVSVKIIGKQTERCSGVLIDDDIVLTAAHCLTGVTPIDRILVSPSNVAVTHWQTENAPIYEVQRACLSSVYHKGAYDAAYLKLVQRIPMTRQVNTACLPMKDLDESTPARAVGQGLSYWQTDSVTIQPKKVQVLPVHRVLACESINARRPGFACFKDYDPRFVGSACPGDSGGPVYVMDSGIQTVVALIVGGEPFTNTTTQCLKGESKQFYGSDLSNFKNKFHVLIGIKECIDTGKGIIFNRATSFKSYTTPEASEDEC